MVVDDTVEGWPHTGLRVATLAADESCRRPGGGVGVRRGPPVRFGPRLRTAPRRDRPDGRARREALGLLRADRRRVRAGRVRAGPDRHRGDLPGRRLRGARGRRRFPGVPSPRRLGRPGRAARRRHRVAGGAQLRHPGRARRGRPHRVRGGHAGRQLELLPAAQARRGAGGSGDRARGDLLLRDPGRGRGPRLRRAGERGPGRLPAGVRHDRAPDRRVRGGAHR